MKYLLSISLVTLLLFLSGCPKDHSTGTSAADRQLYMNTISSSGYDLVVMDYSQNGDDCSAYQRGEIDLLRARGNCLIFAYLSLGVAETNRFYWHSDWVAANGTTPSTTAPSWLIQQGAPARPNYPARWLVKYWDTAWKQIMFGRDSSYLSRILQAGFDGVYLTGMEFRANETGISNPDSAMKTLLIEFADSARTISGHPNFFVIGQNMGAMTRYSDLVQTLDGAAQDAMFYGYGNGDGIQTPQAAWISYTDNLSPFARAGKKVFAVDYPYSSSPDQVYYASPAIDYIYNGRNLAIGNGLLYYPAPRNLDELTIIPGYEPVVNVTPTYTLNQVQEFCIFLRPGPH